MRRSLDKNIFFKHPVYIYIIIGSLDDIIVADTGGQTTKELIVEYERYRSRLVPCLFLLFEEDDVDVYLLHLVVDYNVIVLYHGRQ